MKPIQKTPGVSWTIFRPLAAGAAALALLAAGCASKSERDQAVAEKQRISDETRTLEATVESMKAGQTEAAETLAEVQKGLEEIRTKELAAIRSSIRVASEGKASTDQREQLRAEIQTIREAVHRNLQKLAHLEKANKESGTKVASLEGLTAELKRSLEDKEATVTELQKRVDELSGTVASQKTRIEEQEAQIRQGETKITETTKELHTAYVAVGSKASLRKSGVVEKRGDIAGVGGRWIETGKFDPEVFKEVDVTKDLEVEIPAPAKKVRVVTAQPKEAYEIVSGGPDAKTSKLQVKDPAAFWKGDRYLVVMTD